MSRPCQGCHLLILLSGIGGFQCWSSRHMPIQLPSPLSKWVKPLACHVTTPVLTVISGRSIFGLASWHHPHPSVTQNVAQPAVSCCSPRVDGIRWGREVWPSDIPLLLAPPQTRLLQRPMVPRCSLAWDLWMDCGGIAHGTPGNPPSPGTCRDWLTGKAGKPSSLGFPFLCFLVLPSLASCTHELPKPSHRSEQMDAEPEAGAEGWVLGSQPWLGTRLHRRSAVGPWPAPLAP